MTRLSQMVAIEGGVKTDTHKALDHWYKLIQKTQVDGPLHGQARTFEPFDDEQQATKPPAQGTRVQLRIPELLDELAAGLTRMFDVVATKDKANSSAAADVKLGETVLLRQVPVTTLIFLEKQLTNLKTFISKLPILDPAETWHYSSEAGCYVTEPVETIRYRKVPESFILVPATQHHPAQAQRIDREVPEGKWRIVKFCGALPADRVKELLIRVQTLLNAVKFARQEANTMEIEDQRIGAEVFGYIFG